MEITEDQYLAHYGVLRRSGRYKWGSGDNPASHRQMSFLDAVADLKRQGLSDTEVVAGLGLESTTQLRALKSIAKNQQKQEQISRAQQLKDKGLSNVAIGLKMGLNESSVRALLVPGTKDRADILETTASMLRDQVAEKKYIDIGAGVEHHVGVAQTKLNTAVSMLKEEGYVVHTVPVQQQGTGLNTQTKVLAPPGTTWGDVARNKSQIQQIAAFSDDHGRSYDVGFQPPVKIDPSRIGIKYKEDGGDQADGVLYVRPGVKDVSLGGASYAQVRVSVGDGHYIKGMAMYKNDLPDGVDIQFNTNKSNTGNKLDALKPVSDDPDNPYGSMIKRQLKEGDGPDKKVYSAMNIVNEEGDWEKWSKNLPSQMLSKQSPALARTQLDMTFEKRTKEFNELNALTNPTVRKKMLTDFGDETDAAAVHLKAAAIRNQGTHIILPISSMPPTQIYAPNYKDGERVALVRFPHGGTFEIPELTVNNNQREAKSLLKGARDAVGIHHSVAERLSGADFDGDTVLVIPNGSGKIKSTPALEGLKNFDPRSQYKHYEGMPKMTPQQKGLQMGLVSNLITDMTIHRAPPSEMARAIRHSMVVIDAEKHHLDYKRSAQDNGISQLKAKYQGSARGGASTLISNSGTNARVAVDERKPRTAAKGGSIDRETGKRVFEETGATRTLSDGTVVRKQTKVAKLALTDDAHSLSSGTPMERLYADHSNRLKALANQARKEAVNTPNAKYSPSARETYLPEVKRLSAALVLAERNAPLERQAQTIAASIIKAKRQAYPDMDDATLKKERYRALQTARARTGAGKERIIISDREWEAIQAGAISDSRLSKILSSADLDRVRELATPRTSVLMTPAKSARAAAMLERGFTRAEVAAQLGVSLTTLDTATEGG